MTDDELMTMAVRLRGSEGGTRPARSDEGGKLCGSLENSHTWMRSSLFKALVQTDTIFAIVCSCAAQYVV